MKKTLLAIGISAALILSSASAVNQNDYAQYVQPEYTVLEEYSRPYVRDGFMCCGYYVIPETPVSELTDDDLYTIFYNVTACDGFYRRTVWIYDDAEKILAGQMCDAMVEQTDNFSIEITSRIPYAGSVDSSKE